MPLLLPEERVGTTIADKYLLDSILGRGGMGVVFAGHHQWTNRPVAVKLLSPEYAHYAEAVDRFMQEARAAARLTTPHVVDVLDMGQEADGTVYMVLEKLEGEPLNEHLDRVGTLSVQDTLTILGPVMDALVQAHSAGIVHRDLKPDNIYLATGSKGETIPKLLDFGVAKVAQASRNTKTGTVVGTPHYMSPEQVRGDANMGPSADIWSMGVLIYECLSGRLPYPGDSTMGVLTSILVNPPEPLDANDMGLPSAVVELIHSTLEANPADRPPTMEVLHERLVALSSGDPAPPVAVSGVRPSMKPPARPEAPAEVHAVASSESMVSTPTSRGPIYAALGFVLVVLLVGGGWLALAGDDPAQESQTSPSPMLEIAPPADPIVAAEPTPPLAPELSPAPATPGPEVEEPTPEPAASRRSRPRRRADPARQEPVREAPAVAMREAPREAPMATPMMAPAPQVGANQAPILDL